MFFRGGTARYLHYAVHVIRVAALDLNLDGAVSDSEIMLQLVRACRCISSVKGMSICLRWSVRRLDKRGGQSRDRGWRSSVRGSAGEPFDLFERGLRRASLPRGELREAMRKRIGIIAR